MNASTGFGRAERVKKKVLKEEVPFDVHELFFSRTDERGVIETGNGVFKRIAQYSWDRLLGAPHKIIRHPDMPRAVFWLLWETIKAGQPVGAYVKNLAEDGRYYWVFAVVTPVDGGYLSVRLKPTSPLLQQVEAAYTALAEREKEENLEPAESAAILLETLKALGFDDYPAFMAHALSEEYLSRMEGMGCTARPEVRNYRKLMSISDRMLSEAAKIADKYGTNRFVALNMRVRAARMGGAGKTVGVISNDYNIHSDAMLEQMDVFTSRAKELGQTVAIGGFMYLTAALQREAIEAFESDTGLPDEIDRDFEANFLARQQNNYHRQAEEGIQQVSATMRSFSRRTEEMQRIVSGLEVTRIMGMIECSHLHERGKTLLNVLNDLEVYQQEVSDILSSIDDANMDLHSTIQQMV